MTTQEPWTPSAGDTIGGRYRIQGELGEGGIVRVWEGRDTQTGQTVAVKHIKYGSDNYDRSPQKIESLFQREVETLREVRDAGGHPNIISLHDVVSHRGTQLAVVETVDGPELDDPSLEFSEDEARDIVIGLADAMGFLHENEIIYRDLKPDNAMLRRDGSPVLIDFNTAKQLDGDVDASVSCPNCGESVQAWDSVCPRCNENFGGSEDTTITAGGTNPYKPPETTQNKSHFQQGPWSDVYSLAKFLHYLVDDRSSGVPPVDDAGPQDFGVDCPDYMHEIITRGTKENTGERYNNARTFKIVLENRDPEPPASAELTYLEADKKFTIEPGDTVGREGASGPAATITIEKDDDYISAVQVQFDIDTNGDWILRDRSLNGTYVQQGNGWQRVLCEHGRNRLQKKGQDPTDRHGNIAPETLELGDGDLIALVHPEYSASFKFEEKL